MPRQGTKQVIKTTVKGPSQITKERRDDYKEKLQKYKKFRTDLKAEPVPDYQAPKGGLGDASYQAPQTGMGPKSPKNKAYRAAQAKAHRAAIKKRNLGSPGHVNIPVGQQPANLSAQANLQNIQQGQATRAAKNPHMPADAPVYYDMPPINAGESDADYDVRYQQYFDDWHQKNPGYLPQPKGGTP